MTQFEFIRECQERTIDPAIAIENGNIREALRDKNKAEVIRILNEEF